MVRGLDVKKYSAVFPLDAHIPTAHTGTRTVKVAHPSRVHPGWPGGRAHMDMAGCSRLCAAVGGRAAGCFLGTNREVT
jgi:hypothetical protein